MSVIYFTDEEFSEIYNNLADIVTRDDSIVDISAEVLMQFMVRVGLCNRLAYEYNYHQNDSDKIVLEIPKIEVSDYSKMSFKKLIERFRLLEYNCVTNFGRCFLDSKDKELFEELEHDLDLRYIKLLERKAN
ncbi:MAG: hypothetical protein A2Y10_13115 [Planctomycetes bacterium GWF2_41_51]|nr:MAG: hypothetical protein A2Y10_13115 [Planctomycetes bacterium GWF2_41_51]HBG60703.1 hypothetical protein [Candidatus Omnitrophota bacterium]